MANERPRVSRAPVVIPPLVGGLDALWTTICEVADRLADVPWTVVGGQMVLLHALEHDTLPPRVSTDLDALVDLRVDRSGIRKIVKVLQGLDFGDTGPSPEGYVHRFESRSADGPVVIDLLVPEGLGPRADTASATGGKAFPTPGGTQALARTELVPIRHRDRTAWIPRPSLLGAVVGKAVAATADRAHPERHLRDLAFLCGLVDDPVDMAARLGATDRRRLRAAAKRLSEDDPAWTDADDPREARAAWRVLVAGNR